MVEGLAEGWWPTGTGAARRSGSGTASPPAGKVIIAVAISDRWCSPAGARRPARQGVRGTPLGDLGVPTTTTTTTTTTGRAAAIRQHVLSGYARTDASRPRRPAG